MRRRGRHRRRGTPAEARRMPGAGRLGRGPSQGPAVLQSTRRRRFCAPKDAGLQSRRPIRCWPSERCDWRGLAAKALTDRLRRQNDRSCREEHPPPHRAVVRSPRPLAIGQTRRDRAPLRILGCRRCFALGPIVTDGYFWRHRHGSNMRPTVQEQAARARHGSDRRCSGPDHGGLGRSELIQCVKALLAAVPGTFEAAEGQLYPACDAVRVHVDLASMNRRRDSMCA